MGISALPKLDISELELTTLLKVVDTPNEMNNFSLKNKRHQELFDRYDFSPCVIFQLVLQSFVSNLFHCAMNILIYIEIDLIFSIFCNSWTRPF